MEIFSSYNISGIFRWLHIWVGIIWIGHLYYFNFTQTPFMAEADAASKSGLQRLLLPRALWWFRYGALYTFVTGLILLGLEAHGNPGFFSTQLGVLISIGITLATLMFLNVWLIIWPNQKVVIANALQVASGGQAIANVAACAAKAGLASRHNTLFSIPMLLLMGAGRHLILPFTETSNINAIYASTLVLIAALEVNAVKGKMGPLATVKGTITSGFALTVVIFALVIAFL